MSKMDDKVKFAVLFTGLCEAYDKEASKTLMATYYESLKDLITIDEFRDAIGKLLVSRKYTKLPLPADILDMSGKCISIEDEALVALTKVEDAMASCGRYYTVVFDDETIHKVISRLPGGWTSICAMTDEEWKKVKKDFLKMYQVFKKTDMDYPSKLIGIHDYNNDAYIKGGIKKETIAYIGDKAKALAWMSKRGDVKSIADERSLSKEQDANIDDLKMLCEKIGAF